MSFFVQSRKILKKSKQTCSRFGRNRKGNRVGCLEALEMRSMMASDVIATVYQGRLQIAGDNEQDSILVAPGAVRGEFVVSGKVNKDGSTTTINGLAQQTFSGVTERIYITLYDGADTVKIEEIRNVELRIETGSGDDDISIGKYVPIPVSNSNEPIVVPVGVIDLMTGEGNDKVFIGRVFGNSIIAIQGEGGDDTIEIYNATASEVSIAGGEGDDQINVGYLTSRGILSVNGEVGNDSVNVYCSHAIDLALIVGGEGTDTVAADVCKFDAWLYLFGGEADEVRGDDTVLFARSIFSLVEIQLGCGNNTLYFGKYYDYDNENNLVLRNAGSLGEYARILGIDNANDHVDIAANVINFELDASFGSGSNTAEISYNLIKAFHLHGEGGTNTVKKIHNIFETEEVTGFIEE